MQSVKVIYGSSTGSTQNAALAIALALNGTAINISDAQPEDFQADLLILGTSTWGWGELQDDWLSGINKLDALDLNGKKVAVFGLGDQEGFADTFVAGMKILADKLAECGAIRVGETSAKGYSCTSCDAIQDGKFCGLALDDTNQPEKTASRISLWAEALKKEGLEA
ncbi:MAG: flavodoxin [Planctomycetia bacterium]|nr:flavodoxin [Planctomycetia bacterium]